MEKCKLIEESAMDTHSVYKNYISFLHQFPPVIIIKFNDTSNYLDFDYFLYAKRKKSCQCNLLFTTNVNASKK